MSKQKKNFLSVSRKAVKLFFDVSVFNFLKAFGKKHPCYYDTEVLFKILVNKKKLGENLINY